jgi:short-subunit dehydrogenase
MRQRYGPSAVIVGASEGLGAAFAWELAAYGFNLVLVARRAALLNQLAGDLNTVHGVQVRALVADVSTPDGVATVSSSNVDGEDVGLLVCNAALAPVSPFLDLIPEQLDEMLDVNCRSAMRLAHAFGGRMVTRGRGGVILLSSIAGQQGSALVAHYAATKAYLRVLAEGLWYEWRPLGVDVLACCPGLVRTPTYERGGPTPGRLVPPPMSPDIVAREALAALGRRPVMVPGIRNKATAALAARLIPRRTAITAASRETATLYRARA